MWGQQAYSKWQGKVDTEIGSLGERIAGVESTMKNVDTGLSNLTKMFNVHNQMQQEAARPPYVLFIGAISLVVLIIGGIIGAFSAGYVRDIERIEATQLREANHVYLHETTFGHPALNQQVKMLIGKTEDLDTGLQREMRLLNDTINVKVEGLDTRLQREMELRERIFNVKADNLERRIGAVENIR